MFGKSGYTAVNVAGRYALLTVLKAQNISLDGKNDLPVFPGFYCFEMSDTLQVSDTSTCNVGWSDYPVYYSKVDQLTSARATSHRAFGVRLYVPTFTPYTGQVYGVTRIMSMLAAMASGAGRGDISANFYPTAPWATAKASIDDLFQTVVATGASLFKNSGGNQAFRIYFEGSGVFGATANEGAVDVRGSAVVTFVLLAGVVDQVTLQLTVGGLRNGNQSFWVDLVNTVRFGSDSHDLVVNQAVNLPAGVTGLELVGKFEAPFVS